jgi:serine/threonine-protein kinase
MELIEGETLAARLERMDTMQPHDVASLLANVAEVLASVHSRSIVHRDLKPENLIYSSESRFPIRVIDWGVARLGPVGKLTLEGMTPGTPIYMSPEQATGKNVGAPCDIYSLGVIAYEALSGEPPFDGRTLAEVVSMHLTADAVPLRSRCKAPRALCSLIHRMLAKDQTERPTAVQLGRLAKAIVSDLAPAYEEYIITHQSHYPAQQHLMQTEPTGETCVVDPQVLELGSTQPLGQPTRKLRWTPEISSTHMTGGAIVVGEILSKH